MKRVQPYLVIAIVSAGFFTLSACAFESASSLSSLHLHWSLDAARSYLPSAFPVIASYDITVNAEGESGFTAYGVSGTELTVSELLPLSWHVRVTARDDKGQAIADGEALVDLSDGQTRNVRLVLHYIMSGDGSGVLELGFDWSALSLSDQPDTAVVRLTGPDGGVSVRGLVLAGSKVVLALDPTPVGSYVAFLSLSKAGTLYAWNSYSALVYAGAATRATIRLSEKDFGKGSAPPENAVLDGAFLEWRLPAPNTASAILVERRPNPDGGVSWERLASDLPPTESSYQDWSGQAEIDYDYRVALVNAFDWIPLWRNARVLVTNVTIETSDVSPYAGDPPFLLNALVHPNHAQEKDLLWSSSDPSVAAVADGMVTPLSGGTVTISAIAASRSEVAASRVIIIAPYVWSYAGGRTVYDAGGSSLLGGASGPLGAIYFTTNDNRFFVMNPEDDHAVSERRFDGYTYSHFRDVAVAPDGTIYLAQTNWPSGPIYRVEADGGLTELAVDNQIQYLASTPSGDIFFTVPDYGQASLKRVVRRIATDGGLSVFAGSGEQGSVDGVGTAASFQNPTFICADRFGALYVVDGGKVRKISAAGQVSTLFNAGALGYSLQGGIAADRRGNVYFIDITDKLIKVTPRGEPSVAASAALVIGPGYPLSEYPGAARLDFWTNDLVITDEGVLYVMVEQKFLSETHWIGTRSWIRRLDAIP